MEIKYSKIPKVNTFWKTDGLWQTYIEFSKVSPIWKIIHQNYEYNREEEENRNIQPNITCYYERNYYSSNIVYHTPIFYTFSHLKRPF